MLKIILLANLAVTGFLTGLVWFVQVVHYPLFAKVTPPLFSAYHAAHTRTTGSLVVLPMLAELILAILLLGFTEKPAMALSAWAAFFLAVAVWLLTFGIFLPLHAKLAAQFDPQTVTELVAKNWWRTWAWTFRLLLLVGFAWSALMPD